MGKHLKYLRYVLRHKWFVLYAGVRWTHAPIIRLLIHDWSKFSRAEWGAYAERFFGSGSKSGFDAAWKHHLAHNKHHWDHWNSEQGSIPEPYVREMVADWMGAGRAISGEWEASTWYLQHREEIVLNPENRSMVEELLAIPKR